MREFFKNFTSTKYELFKAVKPTKKANKNDLVIPAGKMSDEDAEGAIAADLKKLGNRVEKGSKVTLASNVDNLKVCYISFHIPV